MGQERFAEVVQRFTDGFGVAADAVSAESVKQWPVSYTHLTLPTIYSV